MSNDEESLSRTDDKEDDKRKKKKIIITICILVAVVGLIGLAIYYFLSQKRCKWTNWRFWSSSK